MNWMQSMNADVNNIIDQANGKLIYKIFFRFFIRRNSIDYCHRLGLILIALSLLFFY